MLRRKSDRHHRRLRPPMMFVLGMGLMTNATWGATFNTLEVTQRGGSYQVRGEAHLDTAPQQVYAELVDFKRLPEINPNVRVSNVIKVIDTHSQLVYTETVGCVFIFCHTIKQVQRFSEPDPQDIVAVTVPGSGNVKRGMSFWHLQADSGGTRLSWTASCEPAFWVPPFIGPRAIENQLRSQALASIQEIERLAQKQAGLVPNTRTSLQAPPNGIPERVERDNIEPRRKG